ncbi:hypothetical protein [Methylobacterium cerastii]|uniref:hypothetical protein n=1 Tax=Methylobacterium cerastii TaxID=932741 RepID=UPI001EE3590C|nr:hypothetical protein [Methylobacterium cerastii]
MPKIPTIAAAGLWSAITVAALTVVALGQSQPARSTDQTAAPAGIAADPTRTASIILTDATGKQYRTRRD